MKDLDWLKNQIARKREGLALSYAEGSETEEELVFNNGKDKAFEEVEDLLKQVTETKITEQDAWNKIAESSPMSANTLKSHINLIGIYNGDVKYGTRK